VRISREQMLQAFVVVEMQAFDQLRADEPKVGHARRADRHMTLAWVLQEHDGGARAQCRHVGAPAGIFRTTTPPAGLTHADTLLGCASTTSTARAGEARSCVDA
jgi:hypothetical protein